MTRTPTTKGYSREEKFFMKSALTLAVRELGNVWPNPAVGCVIVKDGEVIGHGWTQRGGRPHAEFMALIASGPRAKGASAYVTLEPCAHEGETPSCARLLAEAGIAWVYYAIPDPDPRTCGQGAEILKKSGVKVRLGPGGKEAGRINQGFLTRVRLKRPMVTLKIAASKDGKIAAGEGIKTQVTGPKTNEFTQKLRAKYDAILVGIGTVLADDPLLTCRIGGLEDQSPVRIILDRRLRTPAEGRLAKTAATTPLWIVSEKTKMPQALAAVGVELITVKNIKNIKEVIEKLAKKGITRLLVEGGASVATSFYEAGVLDYVYLIRNRNLTLGPEAVPAFRRPNILKGARLKGFKNFKSEVIEEDVIDFFRRKD